MRPNAASARFGDTVSLDFDVANQGTGPTTFAFRDRVYLMRGVLVNDYRAAMRTRSPRWGTVHLPTAAFRQLVKPFSHFLNGVHHKDTKDAQRHTEKAEINSEL